MSIRVLLGCLLACCATSAVAESHLEPASVGPVVHLGDSPWSLYRPAPMRPAIYDLGYEMRDLRCDQAGFGIRFSRSERFALDFKVSPLIDSDDYIGPVYDMGIGATQLVVSFGF